mgnify:CR=1 FL=1
MKVLELFSGTESFSKVAKARGHEVFTIDYNSKFKPNLCIDILSFNKSMLQGFKPEIIWASPPCETFSLSGNSYYHGYPTTSKSYIGLALAYKCLEIIRELKPKYWIIENPRAGLRNVWFMKPLEKTTASYCQYGMKNMKPTDLWNNFGFKAKLCKNGDNCHVSAPRGSKTGTQGEKSTEVRGIIPEKLCLEIIKVCEQRKLR